MSVRATAARPRLGIDTLDPKIVPSAVAAHARDSIVVGFRLADGSVSRGQEVAVPAGLSVAQAIDFYESQADVAYAEENYTFAADRLPNDPSYNLLYGLNNTGQTVSGVRGTADADTDAAEAHDLTVGSLRTVVSVLDTGIDYTHPDLYLNVWLNQAEIPTSVRANLTDVDADGLITFYDLNDARNIGAGKAQDLNGNRYIDAGDLLRSTARGGWEDGVDGGNNGYVDDLIGWDFVGNDNDPMDVIAEDGGHGTHVAGTIGAVGDNGVGVAGVAWRVQMMALRFLGADGGDLADAVNAVYYSVDNGAKVSNNSWGGGGYSQALFDAITYSNSRGQIFVAAAGNESANNDTTASYPANYNVANVVSVAATDNRDRLASFSNRGRTTVDLAAPGVSILSTYPGGQYEFLDGTSMATPHVAGAFALLVSADPSLSNTAAINRVLSTVDPVAALATTTVTGGRLNVNNALRAGPTPTPTPTPTPAPGTYTNATPVNIVDNGTVVSRITVSDSTTIGDLNVRVNIAHTYTDDLVIKLKGPDGTTITLFNRRGSDGDNLNSTKFDDEASAAIASGTAGFAGTFRPEQALSAFDGKLAKGTWELIVQDVAGGDTGRVNSWSLEVTAATTPPPADTAGAFVTGVTPNATGSNPVSGLRVVFNEAVNASTFTAADVRLTGPGGAAVAVTSVTAVGTTGREFDVRFASQSTWGAYAFAVGPNVADLAGNLMDQDRDGVKGEATQDQFAGTFSVTAPTPRTYSNTTPVNITDNGTVVSRITITDAITVGDLNVRVNLTHTYTGDLVISLRGPDGTLVTLFDRRGGSGDNLNNTLFNDEAGTAISAGTAGFAGSFRPEQLLSAFDGKLAQGTWELIVQDTAGGDVGRLVSWSMDVIERAGTSARTMAVGPGRPLTAEDVAVADATSNRPAARVAAALGRIERLLARANAAPPAVGRAAGPVDLFAPLVRRAGGARTLADVLGSDLGR